MHDRLKTAGVHSATLLWSALMTGCSVVSMQSTELPSPSGHSAPDFRADNVDAALSKLRGGGYVIVMRHATTDREQVDETPVALGDCSTQRNLNDIGRLNARGWGKLLRAEDIRVSHVIAGEYCRTRETAEYIGFEPWEIRAALTLPEAGDLESEKAQGEALRALARRVPETGTNVLLISHNVNIVAAFADKAVGLNEADALVVKPSGTELEVVARLPIRALSEYLRRKER